MIDSGNTAWVLASAALVLFMTLPGLALFYAGLVRRKNVLATLMQSFILIAAVSVVWVIVGYTLAFDVGTPFIGGGGAAMAALEALTRGLSAELAPQGIRVVGLRPQGMPETDRIKQAFESYAAASGMTWNHFEELLASRTHTRRLSTLEEMANMAVFLASDMASGMTGTTVNLSMGSLDD